MAENSYIAEQTPKTPIINFNASSGNLELKGKSIPEHSVAYYKPLFEWLEDYIQKPASKTTLNIQLDYFNTMSSKCIIDLFKKIEQIPKSGKGEAIINWYYDDQDDDMLEAGEDYKSVIKIPFNLISFTK